MYYCADIKLNEIQSKNISKYCDLNSFFFDELLKQNIDYFGILPDNDSDAQDDLLSNATYLRIISESNDEISLQEFLEIITKNKKEAFTINFRNDTGLTKNDLYIEITI